MNRFFYPPGLSLDAPGFFGILIVLYIACMWRIFNKAGEAGWKSLIPVYSTYIYFRVGWDSSRFWRVFLGSVIVGVLCGGLELLGGVMDALLGFIYTAWGVYIIVITIKLQIRMAHRFGKSTAFGVIGLWIFSLVGLAILAWGSSDYNAARDTGDGTLCSDAELNNSFPSDEEFWNHFSGKR